jgi:TonB family protein
LTTPSAGLPDTERFTLVSAEHEETPIVRFTPSMAGWIEVEGRQQALSALSRQSSLSRRVHSTPLTPTTRARVVHGRLTFDIRIVERHEGRIGRSRLDRPFWFYNAAAFIILGTLLVLVQFMPQPALGLSWDGDAYADRYVSFVQRSDSRRADLQLAGHRDAGGEGNSTGEPHRGTSGAMGQPELQRSRRLYALRGPATARRMIANGFDPIMEARHAGIMGLIDQGAGHFAASPYGSEAIGREDEDVWGQLSGTEIGQGSGVGGLGLVGRGRGGGGQGEGTIGLGDVGAMGMGGGCGGCGGHSRGSSTGLGDRRARVPRVRTARAKPCGCWIPDNVIRRIVRAHLGEIRYCYNQALTRDPNRRGKVEIQFMINEAGTVPAAIVLESSLDDHKAERCMVKAVRRWKFPKPRGPGGSAKVNYPFVFEPG